MIIDVKELIYYLEIQRGSVISVVGSGGKTTLISKLADTLKDVCRVCVGATTHMEYPNHPYLFLKEDVLENKSFSLEKGLFYAADGVDSSKKKISGFSSDILNFAKENSDVILLESDGSHRRPLKGWADYEPVVLDETSMTIGVIPSHMFGQVLTEENVHRFPYFTQITGAKPGDIFTKDHAAALISHKDGLFKCAKGEKVLFFSQATNDERIDHANDVLDLDSFDWIDKIIIGSFFE